MQPSTAARSPLGWLDVMFTDEGEEGSLGAADVALAVA